MKNYISKGLGKVKNAAIATTVGLAALVGGNADAGSIDLYNTTTTSGVHGTYMTLKNIPEGIEGYNIRDGPYLNSPYSNVLEIYTIVEGNKLGLDTKPVKTKGWDFLLGVKGTATCNDTLKAQVTSTTDLADPIQINLYDQANPSVKYPVPKDGTVLTIPLTPLVNETQNPYATWRADLDCIVNVGQSYTLDDVVSANTIVKGDGVLNATSINSNTLTIGEPGNQMKSMADVYADDVITNGTLWVKDGSNLFARSIVADKLVIGGTDEITPSPLNVSSVNAVANVPEPGFGTMALAGLFGLSCIGVYSMWKEGKK